MLKKIFVFATISIFLTALTFSCSKTSKTDEPVDLYEQMKQLGDMHNKYVIGSYNYAKSKMEIRNQNSKGFIDPALTKSDILDYFKTINFDPSIISLSYSQYWTNTETMLNYIEQYNYDFDNVPQKTATAATIPYFERIIEIVEENSTIVDIHNALDNYKTTVENNLTGTDLVAVLGTIQITKSSTYLWFPEELGGYDLLTKTFGRPNESNNKGGTPWWKRAIYGDLLGSAQYFAGIGIGGIISAAFIPGTNAVLFGGWAISAGASSACGALGM